MSRSLLRQLEQIRRSETYDDAVTDVYTSTVAEPTVSGSLQEDLNVIRTLTRLVKGTTDWFGDVGNYFDPTNTSSGNALNKEMNLTNIKGHTLDSKTILIAVSDDNAGSGFTVSGTSTGFLLNVSTAYATPTDRRGLPIFASTANAGSYYDEGGEDRVCVVDVIDVNTNASFQTTDGYLVYAKFHDGADFSGVGTGTDAYVRFYANNAVTDLTSISGTTPSLVSIVYPQRKRLSDVNEYEWNRTDFISSWEGDVELVEDISNLWSFTGASDNDTAPTWTNTGSYYALQTNPSTLEGGIDTLNDVIGDRNLTESNYAQDNTSITAMIDALDMQVKDNTDAIGANSVTKLVESVAVQIDRNTEHYLPLSQTYTPVSTAGYEGANMDVYVNGQLLAADTGVAGANADRDYAETTASGITFRFNVKADANITYIIRQ